MSSVSQCCRELRFIETKTKILNKKGFVFSVTNASIFACPNRAPISLGWAWRKVDADTADHGGGREGRSDAASAAGHLESAKDSGWCWTGRPPLRPAQRGGVRREHRMERFRRASVVSAIGSGAGAAGRAHLGSAGPAAAAPEAVALGEPEPEPEPALTRAERRGEVIYAAVWAGWGHCRWPRPASASAPPE